MERVSREAWAKRVERWRGSGLTAAEYAAEIGVKPQTPTRGDTDSYCSQMVLAFPET
jgi:hypothetical protein